MKKELLLDKNLTLNKNSKHPPNSAVTIGDIIPYTLLKQDDINVVYYWCVIKCGLLLMYNDIFIKGGKPTNISILP